MFLRGYENIPEIMRNTIPTILSQRDEGNVYLYEDFVVKERIRSSNDQVCKPCIRREFDVGVLANESPFLVQTLGYYEVPQGAYVITKLVPGKPLIKFEQSDPVLLIQILLQIAHLQQELEFTHYDLHHENIIVEELPELQEVNYSVGKVLTPYKVTFIDLARSHIRGIKSSFAESRVMDEATTPGIFDPMFDYATFIAPLSFDDAEVEDFLLRNGFAVSKDKPISDDDERSMYVLRGYPLVRNVYMMDDLLQDDKIWASAAIGRYSMEQVYLSYANFVLEVKNVTDDEVERLALEIAKEDDQYPINPRQEVANRYFPLHGEGYEEKIEDYIKALGRAAVHDKLLDMESRPNDHEEMLQLLLSFITRNFYS